MLRPLLWQGEFSLPDGRTLRFYHTAERRNCVEPPPEPPDVRPDHLSALQGSTPCLDPTAFFETLPPRYKPPYPNRRDVSAFGQSIFLGAPMPQMHTLPAGVKKPDLWYGTIAQEALQIGAREILPKPPSEKASLCATHDGRTARWAPTAHLYMPISASSCVM